MVNRGKLLVFGQTNNSAPISYSFELIEFEDTSATRVKSVTELDIGSIDFIMHDCDPQGGAWFKGKNSDEINVFYDAGTSQFFKSPLTPTLQKIVSVVNSRRGHYIIFTYNLVTDGRAAWYSTPDTFWSWEIAGSLGSSYVWTNFLRLDISTQDERIFYLTTWQNIPSTQAQNYSNTR